MEATMGPARRVAENCLSCKWCAIPNKKEARKEVEKAFETLEKECVIVLKDSRKEAKAMLAMAKNAAYRACDKCVCVMDAFDGDGFCYSGVFLVSPDFVCEFWEEVDV